MMRNDEYVCNEGMEIEEVKTDACNNKPGFLSRFKDICKYNFSGLKLDMTVMFIYLITIVTAIAVIGFGYAVGQDDYSALIQPSNQISPWIVLLTTGFAVIFAAFGSYILHQMTEGIVRYTFMLTFLFILVLLTIAFVSLYLFASPWTAQYIALIAIVASLWFAVFSGTISYVAAGLFLLVSLALGFLFVVASRISAVN